MPKQPSHPHHDKEKKTPALSAESSPAPKGGITDSFSANGPQFSEPISTPDPTKFTAQHGSDTQAYSILDSQKGHIPPTPFPVAIGGAVEPILQLADAFGPKGKDIVGSIEAAKQIVFHALGDTGNTRSAAAENSVTDKLVSDFDNEMPHAVPSFAYILGDVVYSFGEAEYYYDQFYDPYRDYPAPIFAIGGNHDGMVSPVAKVPTLKAFLANFCTAGQPPHRTPEAGNLARTAGIQPGVYFTLEAPFVRIIGLYSNSLEDPGIISTQSKLTGKHQEYPNLTDVQLDFLEAALNRIKAEKYAGAILIAVHHPPYVAIAPSKKATGKHGNSPEMLADIDRLCHATGVWPHAVLSGHAHNYQRFTRYYEGRETPFVLDGNGGHAHNSLTKKGAPALRVPSVEPVLSNGKDKVVFDNYDDTNYGYLRIIADAAQLRIEYHPASDGSAAKTPDDTVTVDLKSYKLVHFQPPA